MGVSRRLHVGEFLLLEQQPRSQWRGTSITLNQGEAIIFPTRDKPAFGPHGFYKANIRQARVTKNPLYKPNPAIERLNTRLTD